MNKINAIIWESCADTAMIQVTQLKYKNLLKRKMKKNPDIKYVGENDGADVFEVPLKLIKISSPKAYKEEELARRKEQMTGEENQWKRQRKDKAE